MTATVQTSPPQVSLQWNTAGFPLTEQKIYRRPNDQANWSLIASPNQTTTSFVDDSVSPEKSYEYWIYRTFPELPSTASGYIRTGIRAPMQADRGRLILLVEASMATPLANELAQWEKDLAGDGWTVVRQDVSRTATPPTVKSVIQNLYAQDPATTKALILFGNIPVAYSGDFAADGHLEHYGAWPADVYYADMDGTWTDTTIDDEGGLYVNWNTPGDGKFDQSQLPSDVELQTGRIDLSDLPAFSLSETELLRQYLNRNHDYRFRQGNFANVPRRALIVDKFGFFVGDSFATDAWRSLTPICGVGNVIENQWDKTWFELLETEPHLWAYGCGGGSSDGAFGVATTADFASKDSLAVFNMLFGSWFGDWNQQNNFLRAPIAGRPGSLGLASCYTSRPRWVFHPMALGETIGYCTKLSQNNAFKPLKGYDSNNTERFVLSALQGDPTLRLYPVIPPTSLTATPASNQVTLSWTASADSQIEGYIISRAPSSDGAYTQLHGAILPNTTFIDRSANPGTTYSYMVRAVKLETSPSGTFLNPSQGIFSPTITTAQSTTAEINLSGLGKSISSGDTLPIFSNGTNFGDVVLAQAGVSRTYTLSNPGTSSLLISSAQISGPHAADFSIITPPASELAPGGITQFEISFMPTALGIRSATIAVTSDDPDETNFEFAIHGNCVGGPAIIAAHPPFISRSINPGTTANSLLTISNPSNSPLTHKLTSSLSKYTFNDSNTPGGPIYQWREISETGTLLTWQDTDEGLSPPVPIGFDFPFYGNNFPTLRVCTNGFVTFTGKISYGANSILPNISCPENMIAAFWNDIFIASSGQIYHESQNGEFIIQYEAIPLYGNLDTRVTCQIILKPNGEILLQYKALTQSGNNYTIGIQNATNDEALLIAYNTNYVQPGLAVRINPPNPVSWFNASILSGTLAPNTTQSIPISINSSILSLGDYFGELTITSDDPLVQAQVIPVQMKVGNTPIQDWRQANFQTTAPTGDASDDANPDGDGSINLFEYAFVSDPASPQSTAHPSAQIHANGYLETEFKRHTDRTDLRYIVQVATDLAGPWTDIATSDHGAPTRAISSYSVSESGNDTVKTVTVQDLSPSSSFPRRFIRLAIMRD